MATLRYLASVGISVYLSCALMFYGVFLVPTARADTGATSGGPPPEFSEADINALLGEGIVLALTLPGNSGQPAQLVAMNQYGQFPGIEPGQPFAFKTFTNKEVLAAYFGALGAISDLRGVIWCHPLSPFTQSVHV